jgi:hypothetical protein
MKSFIFFSLCLSGLFLCSCGGSSPANSNTNMNTNTNGNVKMAEVPLNPANMPPGISNNPVIYDAANKAQSNSTQPKGTPTPGIPSEAELRKPMKPGATPTPGIPSQEELKKMMSGKPPAGANVNAPPPAMMKKDANTPPLMMKSNKVTNGKLKP